MAFDASNFSLLMSTLVEGKYGRLNTPKDVLFQFISAFGSQIRDKGDLIQIIDIIDTARKDGEILFASRDSAVEAFFSQYKKKLPWESPSSPNWIYPVWTSVSGNKSDRYMSRTYSNSLKKIQNTGS